jgi:hypothetical protein
MLNLTKTLQFNRVLEKVLKTKAKKETTLIETYFELKSQNGII